jgi:hypothetical protein
MPAHFAGRSIKLLALLLIGLLSACGTSSSGATALLVTMKTPSAPEVSASATALPSSTLFLPLVTRGILPPPDEASRRIRVPPGFAIRIFAEGLNGKARMMAFGWDGALYLRTHLKTRRPVVVYSVSGQPAWEGKTDGVSGVDG